MARDTGQLDPILRAALKGTLPAAKHERMRQALEAQHANQSAEMEHQRVEMQRIMALADTQAKAARFAETNMEKARSQGEREQQRLVEQRRKAQEQKAKAEAKKGGPTQAVNAAVKGLETDNINVSEPISHGKFDTAGAGGAEAIQQAVSGGRGVQTEGGGDAVAGLQPGAGPDEALAAAQGGPMSLNLGGQQFQAPSEITRTVNELGARPVGTKYGYAMAPTFSSRSITEPNVLTAGQIAGMSQRQEENILQQGMKLWQDSGGDAPLPAAIEGVRAAQQDGDYSKLIAYGVEYPSLSKEAAKADIELRRQQGAESIARQRYYQAQSGLTEAKAALYELQTSGSLGATDWWGVLYPESAGSGGAGRVGAGLGLEGLGRGGASRSGVSKVEVGHITDKEGNINEIAWERYQVEMGREQGLLYYRVQPGIGERLSSIFPGGSDTHNFEKVSIPQLVQAITIVKDPSADADIRQQALQFLDEMPFVHIDDRGARGYHIEGDFGYMDQGAADAFQRAVDKVETFTRSKAPMPEFMTSEEEADKLRARYKAQEKADAGGSSTTTTPTTTRSLAEGGWLRTPEGREPVQRGLSAVGQSIANAANDPANPTFKPWQGATPRQAPGPSGPPIGPPTIDASQPYEAGVLTDVGDPRPQMSAAPPAPPGAAGPATPIGHRGVPTPPLGDAARSLNARDIATLRSLGFPMEVVRTLPAHVVAEILGAAHARSMPPHQRALIPRGMKPIYPRPPHRAAR
jgi:hypothetical protein